MLSFEAVRCELGLNLVIVGEAPGSEALDQEAGSVCVQQIQQEPVAVLQNLAWGSEQDFE